MGLKGDHMIRLSILYTCVLVLVFCMRPAQAQTCSCAGVPILGAMQFATPKTDQWFVAGTYEFHDLSKLVSGSSSIPDETGRDRTSQAFVVEASRGSKAQVGDKTMVDALVPAVEALSAAADDGSSVAEALKKAAAAAAAGAERTKEFQAKFGKARNLGERSLGYKDPGATSMTMFFTGFAEGAAALS